MKQNGRVRVRVRGAKWQALLHTTVHHPNATKPALLIQQSTPDDG